jgi:hypothetical protein
MFTGWLLDKFHSWYLHRHPAFKGLPAEKRKLFLARKCDPNDPICQKLLEDFAQANRAATAVANVDFMKDHKFLARLWLRPNQLAANATLFALLILVGGMDFWPINAAVSAVLVFSGIVILLIDNWDTKRRVRLVLAEQRKEAEHAPPNDG